MPEVPTGKNIFLSTDTSAYDVLRGCALVSRRLYFWEKRKKGRSSPFCEYVMKRAFLSWNSHGLWMNCSKIRYVKFYTRFDMFRMKCFFHEALMFFGHSAKICVIDNTSLAVLHGTGEKAVFHPEMKAFACNYGFEWKAHRIKHPNRKAGTERNFFTLETNFFPDRDFKSLEDLNEQAFEWAVNRFASRPQSKTRLVPKVLFERERRRPISLRT